MGWSFRRRISLGPLKVNLSKSGVGYSVGVPGARMGRDAKGREYSQVSIPGTGIYNRSYGKSARSPSGWVIAAGVLAVLIAILKFLF
jgi:hypothetical protein